MRRGLDVLAIAIWAMCVSVLQGTYRDFGIVLGTAILAVFLVYHNRKLRGAEIEKSLKKALDGLNVGDNVKKQLYEEVRTFLKSKGCGVHVVVFRVGHSEKDKH